ncbi:hypothetical protein LWI28_010624 [Acer negundo]|uniref:Uncharacterized protein n=1 Tax=Acer negundo TaxID=4023 RepID=A0AAD5J522_ACENE|nr:hypothetical protein LWI28_010624 [Acer negundo]
MQAALQAIEIALANGWRWLWMETDSIAVYFCFILQAIEIALANATVSTATATTTVIWSQKVKFLTQTTFNYAFLSLVYRRQRLQL